MKAWYEDVEQAMEGSPAPIAVRKTQVLLKLKHVDFSGQVITGQLVLHEELAMEVAEIFEELLEMSFPINSLVPVASFAWSDGASMEANNSSGFNYRSIVGKAELSRHSFGRAIDINPRQNPYVSGALVLPVGACHDVSVPGTLIPASAAVEAFVRRGWIWGGSWKRIFDWHHFERD